MTLRPADYFIGATDFFSIMLPGVAMTWVVYQLNVFFSHDVVQALQLDRIICESDFYGAIVLIFFGYIIGQIIRGITSRLDEIFERALNRWRAKIGEDTTMTYFWTKNFWRDPYRNAYVNAVVRLKDLLNKLEILVFKDMNQKCIVVPEGDFGAARNWCRNYLCLREGGPPYQRLEFLDAVSKFFRSMILVLLVFIVLFIAKLGTGTHYLVAVVYCVPFLPSSLYLYAFYRYAHALHAFEFTLMSFCLPGEIAPSPEARMRRG